MENAQTENSAAGGASALTVELGDDADRVPFCSDELNDLIDKFMAVMCEIGTTEVDDVIDTAIARCAVKKSRREHGRRLIQTAFDVLMEIKDPNLEGNRPRGGPVE